MTGDRRTVGEVARLARTTVRTLHHYDEIGLLRPSGRSDTGYRLYGDRDLERLHQILVLRELDVPLDTIREILDDPTYDRGRALRGQRELLEERLRRTESIIRAVDAALDALTGGRKMMPEELFEGFDPSEYEDEARERWGGTEAYAESARRARGYS
ncbi:MAG TPA: MerR family transcriptional regulator, partial [Longimicrobiales bacterium]|nr:MerR family transcriptional regulator [Longimicrobiales bacterium]